MVLTVRSRQHWDVKCPPRKKHMIAGKLVPSVRGMMPNISRKKRVVLEVHGQVDEELAGAEPSEELPLEASDLSPLDTIVLRILKPRKHWGFSRDPDTDSDEDEESHHLDDEQSLAAMEEEGWVEYRKFDLDDISEQATVHNHGTTLELQLGRGNHTEVRDFTFPKAAALEDFRTVLRALLRLVRERAAQRAKEFQEKRQAETAKQAANTPKETPAIATDISATDTEVEISATAIATAAETNEPRVKSRAVPTLNTLSSSLDDDEDICLLVEIVSASDLPVADLKSSDPYVCVWLGKEEVHRTKTISKTLDPIWTVDSGSLFLLRTTSRDFFQAQAGLTFLVKDYDAVGSNEVLGKVSLSHDDLLSAKGERVEYPLQELFKGFDVTKVVHPPKLNLRVRPATREDIRFLKALHKVASKKKLGVYADEAFVAPATHRANRLQRETKTLHGVTVRRVKPGPDPERPAEETEWLSKEQIETEHLKPSTNWIETGSGSLGRLYVEILRCDGLPQMDTNMTGGDKTDAFLSLIYEDAIVNSDVINDELSPRWMPWSQRAFLFHMQHSSSQILLGVFDWDGMGRNDPIGRVTIDVTNFYESTDYVLTYNLYESILDEDRTVRGTVTIRLRMEITGHFRNMVLTCVKGLPPSSYVNVTKKEEFRAARFVTCGEENFYKLDMGALKSYGNELEGYQVLLHYIQQALLTVLLWRGHYQVNLCGKVKFKLALHSMTAFIMGVLLVEDFNLFPSFLLFSIAWFMLATNEERQRNPSPWYQSATFGEMWTALIVGRRTTKKEVRVDDELKPLIAAYQEAKEEQTTKKAQKEEAAKKQETLMDEYFRQEEAEAAEEEAGGVDDVETATGGLQLNPLKPILLPIQKILGQVCVVLRVVKSLVIWEESVYAFLLTNACLLGGIALLFVPWGWLIRWVLRIVVWTLLGPWMKLVDILIVRKLQEDGDNFVKRMEAGVEQRSLLLLLRKRMIQTRKEDAQKLRAMKGYMFGKYIVRVPQFKEYRYPDVPLQDYSHAVPHMVGGSAVSPKQRKHGQRLTGHMIMAWGDEGESAILSIKDKSKDSSSSHVGRGRIVKGVMKKANPMRLFRRRK